MPKHFEREELYRGVGGGGLAGAYEKTRKAVEAQAENMEKYPNTPYTLSNAEQLDATARALRHIGDELRAWHVFVYKESS